MHPVEAKKNLRQSITDRLSRLSDKDRHAESRSVCRRILENLPPEPVTVCAYFPLKNEVDLRPLLEELLKKNYPLFLPRIENNAIAFRQVRSLNTLIDGTYGIPEPSENASLLDPAALSIALVPGRAFTRDGRRLGRGNGGYDIWIRKQRGLNPATKFWGVALEAQIVQEMPREEHDEKVDAVVTARGIEGGNPKTHIPNPKKP